MNKRFLVWTLCVVLVACLPLAGALAVPPTEVWVGETNVTTGYQSGQSLYGGQVTYQNGVLTLNGINYNGAGHAAAPRKYAGIYADGDLSLVLVNSSTVVTTDTANNTLYGLYVKGNLTVSGSGALEARTTDTEQACSGVETEGNLTISAGTLSGCAGHTQDDRSHGVHAGGEISASGSATLSGSSGGSTGNYSTGVYAYGSISASGSAALSGVAAQSSMSSIGVYAYGGGVTVSDAAALSGTGGTDSATAASTHGVQAWGDIQVSGGSLKGTARSARDYCAGVYSQNIITVSGGALIGVGANTNAGISGWAFGMRGNNGITLTGGTILATKSAGSTAEAFHSQPGFGASPWYQWRLADSGAYTASTATAYTLAKGNAYVEIVPLTAAASSVSGTVKASDTGAGLVGASVQLKKGATNVGSPVSTGAGGAFTITGVSNGLGYTLEVSSTGYASGVVASFDVMGSNVTGRDVTLVKTLPPSASVSGTVKASDTGAGLVGASVQLKKGATNVGSPISTGAGGAFTLSNVSNGLGYTLEASFPGYENGVTASFDVAGVNLTGQDVTLVKTLPVSISPNDSFPAGASGGPRTVTIGGGLPTGSLGVANLGTVDMDGSLLTKGDEFTVRDGSILLTLSEAYLNTLLPGTYTLTARIASGVYAGQNPTARFIVTAAVAAPRIPPKTGDAAAPLLWAALALFAGAGLTLLLRRRKRA